MHVEYMPIREIARLLLYLRKVLDYNLVIASGVSPWVTASVVVIRKFFRKPTVVDVHGFAWYEMYVTGGKSSVYRVILLASEKIAYENSTFIIVASRWLAGILQKYFHVKNVFIIENAVCFLFEEIVNRLRQLNYELLRKFVCLKVLRLESCDKILLIAPLPGAFVSNILAYRMLLELAQRLPRDVVVVVTGVREEQSTTRSVGNPVRVGYLTYPIYAVLILSSDAVILPYPGNAICGGARNKVLEAGYCRKLVISTRVAMMHIPVLPAVHYLPIEKLEQYLEELQVGRSKTHCIEIIAYGLHKIVMSKYRFIVFRKHLLNVLKNMLLQLKNLLR